MKPAPVKAAARPAEGQEQLNGQADGASKVAEEVASTHDDAELVTRVQNGDHEAFRALFDRYNRRAFAVAFGVLKNQHDALDVVQEAFVKVHKHVGSFQGTSSFYTWLYRIVMNLSIDQVRRKKRKMTEFDERFPRDEAASEASLSPRIGDGNPGKMVRRKELSAHIHAALETLPEYHRAVILLREVEGLSYEEMANVLKVPKGTIMSRLFHARRKMQEQLKDYLEGDYEIAE